MAKPSKGLPQYKENALQSQLSASELFDFDLSLATVQ